MTTKKRKLKLKNVYVVEETPEGSLVHKITKEGEEKEAYLVNGGLCECKASEFGTECKHVAMANGTFSIEDPIARLEAEEILERYLDTVLRPEWPRARIVNLVAYRKDKAVGNAAALACGVLGDRSAEKLTLWTMSEGLLLRIYCFKDYKRYRRVLSNVRQKWSGHEPAKPPVDVGGVGQTYGTQEEEETDELE